jgi:hypothetical protein
LNNRPDGSGGNGIGTARGEGEIKMREAFWDYDSVTCGKWRAHVTETAFGELHLDVHYDGNPWAAGLELNAANRFCQALKAGQEGWENTNVKPATYVLADQGDFLQLVEACVQKYLIDQEKPILSALS